MWFQGMTCHFCNMTIARGEEKEQIGHHFFHRDETKRCVQKYLERVRASTAGNGHQPSFVVQRHRPSFFRFPGRG